MRRRDETPAVRTRSGPRRSEAARIAVLRAADDLLADVGYRGLTVGAIADRAGVAKQTIYRWWHSKAAVLLDVLEEDLADGAPWPRRAEGRRAALETHVTHLSRLFTESPTGRVLFVLIGLALHDPGTATTLRGRVLERQRQHDRERMRALLAPHARTAPARYDADQLLDLLAGPAFHRAFTTRRPLDATFVRHLTGTALAYWRADAPSRRPSDRLSDRRTPSPCSAPGAAVTPPRSRPSR
ncbi:TetR/AcrR family transcriptional regulator [Streptomyces werraensis]|uniref:TetR/AcrR family transcriptional regulator n=1 Tax=Streptomyces werraensis TaxID=68284 RepID=UPI0037D08B4F